MTDYKIALKALRRVKRGKAPDIKGWAHAEQAGWLKSSGPSDDLEIIITPEGEKELAKGDI